MENNRENSGQKLVRTLGWIVGKTIILTSKVMIITFKFGLQFIISRLTTPVAPARIDRIQSKQPYTEKQETVNTI